MKRSEHRNSNSSISSISPPSVQFAIGTPPIGARRRSASGTSLSETPPPPSTWQVSPATHSSPLRRSGTASPPTLSSAILKLPSLSSPTVFGVPSDNNNQSSIVGAGSLATGAHQLLGQRAFTLPELGTQTYMHTFIWFYLVIYIHTQWGALV